jgi:hypothetical protein
MAKILRVITPFFVMELGDTFILSEDGKMYVSEHNEEFRKNEESVELKSSYNSKFNISIDYAKQLIREGYLEEVQEKESVERSTFVNVFDEIDNLRQKYTYELSNIDKDLKNAPQCVKVEKITVLENILKVLDHLKELKK